MTHSFFLILLPLLLLPSSLCLLSSYDPLLAKEAWIYSIASYCNADRLQNWDIADLKTFYPDMKDISVFYSSDGDNQGFVGFNEKTNLVVMVFRGSSSIENWMENIDLIKTSYSRCSVNKLIFDIKFKRFFCILFAHTHTHIYIFRICSITFLMEIFKEHIKSC